jgi:hypothetical protein
MNIVPSAPVPRKSHNITINNIFKAKMSLSSRLYAVFLYLHSSIHSMNSSKMFAGCMIITLNIASKFTTIKLSKTTEAYLKFSFSRDALIFAIAWVGSRDIYIALTITIIFIVFMDFLLNEESYYCIVPTNFCEHYITLLDNDGPTNDLPVSTDEIKRAKEILARADKHMRSSIDNSGNNASENIWQELKPITDDLPVQKLSQYQNIYAYM